MSPDPSAASPPPGSGLDPGRLPWLLRAPVRDSGLGPNDREHDRVQARDARRTALVVLPAVAVSWVAAVALGGESTARIATLAALVVSVFVGARCAVTTQRFRRRWLDPAELGAPPMWVTLLTVAGTIGALVAWSNVLADIRAERSAVIALVLSTVLLAAAALGAYAHLAGGRSVGAALRDPR